MGINCSSLLLKYRLRHCQPRSGAPYKLWQSSISRDPLLGSGRSFSHEKTSKSSHCQGRPRASPRMQRWRWALGGEGKKKRRTCLDKHYGVYRNVLGERETQNEALKKQQQGLIVKTNGYCDDRKEGIYFFLKRLNQERSLEEHLFKLSN